MAALEEFKVPEVEDNSDGWGPCSVPPQLAEIPFAPFSKSDRLGRVSDWTQSAYNKYSGTV